MNIKKIFDILLCRVYYGVESILNDVKVLHITDTPLVSHGALIKFIKKIKPDYIIHTGDIVDNIKLELYPDRIDDYKKSAKKFILELMKYSDNIIIAIGNHDDYKFISDTFKDIIVIEKFGVADIENKKFLIVHDVKDIFKRNDFDDFDYILYGHTYYNDEIEKGSNFYNGLKSINLIYPKLSIVQRFRYPRGTDDSRLMKFRLGI